MAHDVDAGEHGIEVGTLELELVRHDPLVDEIRRRPIDGDDLLHRGVVEQPGDQATTDRTGGTGDRNTRHAPYDATREWSRSS